jgi:RNA polymerase sigma-70 factor (ECF subfamily)
VEAQEQRWIRDAAAGDEAAFRDLYLRYGPRMKVYFSRSGFTAADADDLTQETFVRVYRSLHTYDSQRGAFGPWVATIARNVARRQWHRRRQPESFDPQLAEEMLVGGGNPAGHGQMREEIEALRGCVESLPAEMAQVVRLRYVDGRTTRGISSATGLPEATVRLRLQQALAMVLRCLRRKGVVP